MTLTKYPEPSWVGESPDEPRPEEIKCCPACGNRFVESEGFEFKGKVICSNLCTVANEVAYQETCKKWSVNDELQSGMKKLFEQTNRV